MTLIPYPLKWDYYDCTEGAIEPQNPSVVEFNQFGSFEPNNQNIIDLSNLNINDPSGPPIQSTLPGYGIQPNFGNSYKGSGSTRLFANAEPNGGFKLPELIYTKPVTLEANKPFEKYLIEAWIKVNPNFVGLLSDLPSGQNGFTELDIGATFRVISGLNSSFYVVDRWLEEILLFQDGTYTLFKEGVRGEWVRLLSQFTVEQTAEIYPTIKIFGSFINFPQADWFYILDEWSIRVINELDCEPKLNSRDTNGCDSDFNYCLPVYPNDTLAFTVDWSKFLNDLSPGEYQINLYRATCDCKPANEFIGEAKLIETGEAFVYIDFTAQNIEYGCYFLHLDSQEWNPNLLYNDRIGPNQFPVASNGAVITSDSLKGQTELGGNSDDTLFVKYPQNIFVGFSSSIVDSGDSSYKLNFTGGTLDQEYLMEFGRIALQPYSVYEFKVSIYIEQYWDDGNIIMRLIDAPQGGSAFDQSYNQIIANQIDLDNKATLNDPIGQWIELRDRLKVRDEPTSIIVAIDKDFGSPFPQSQGIIYIDNLQAYRICDHDPLENLFTGYDSLQLGSQIGSNYDVRNSIVAGIVNLDIGFNNRDSLRIYDIQSDNFTFFESPSYQLQSNQDYLIGLYFNEYDSDLSGNSGTPGQRVILEVFEGSPANPGNAIGEPIRSEIFDYNQFFIYPECFIALEQYIPPQTYSKSIFVSLRLERDPANVTTRNRTYLINSFRVLPFNRHEIECEYIEPPNEVEIASDCISVVNPENCNYTSLIKVTHDGGTNELGIPYPEIEEPFGFARSQELRLHFWPQNPEFPTDRKISRTSQGIRRNIHTRVNKVWNYETFYLPDHLHEWIAVALAHTKVEIKREDWDDFVQVVQDSDHNIKELTIYPNPELRKAEGKLAVTPYNRKKDYC